MNRASRWMIAALAASVAASACAPDAPAGLPVPGTLAVSLVTPHGDDGAVLLTLRGEDIGTPVALDPATEVFVLSRSRGDVRVAVVGHSLSGRLVAFDVRDVRRAVGYTATVDEVADGANALRASLSGYRLNVEPMDRPEPGGGALTDDSRGTTIIP